MASLDELRTSVKTLIQEGSITDDQIDVLLNEGLVYCSNEVLLPELESTGVVATTVDANESDLPTSWNFQRNLYAAEVAEASEIKVVTSVVFMKQDYPNVDTETEEGEIDYLTVRNDKIVYYPIPSEATDITCKFYINPTSLATDTDVPTCLPTSLHLGLLKNYVLWKLWELLEDGMEGQKVNTLYHKREFFENLDKLEDHVEYGQSTGEPNRVNGWI